MLLLCWIAFLLGVSAFWMIGWFHSDGPSGAAIFILGWVALLVAITNYESILSFAVGIWVCLFLLMMTLVLDIG